MLSDVTGMPASVDMVLRSKPLWGCNYSRLSKLYPKILFKFVVFGIKTTQQGFPHGVQLRTGDRHRCGEPLASDFPFMTQGVGRSFL